MKRSTHALQTLDSYFSSISFDSRQFLHSFRLSEDEEAQFLSSILYGLYYKDPSYQNVGQYQHPKIFFLILLAETLSEKRMRRILQSQSPALHISLACHCMIHLREGAWILLVLLESLEKENRDWQRFIQGIRRRYYSPLKLMDFLKENRNPSLKSTLKILDEEAHRQISAIVKRLPEVLDVIEKYPTKRFDDVEEVKKRIYQLMENLEKLGNLPHKKIEELQRSDAEDFEIKLAEQFAPFRNRSYTFDEMREYFELFGLTGFPFSLEPSLKSDISLIDGLNELHTLLLAKKAIPGEAATAFIHCMLSFVRKLDIFHHHPEVIASGLNRIVYAVSTRGKNFERMAWLPSVVAGLSYLIDYLHRKGLKERRLSDYPILVFDQAQPKQFAENTLYIGQLAKSSGALIWHLSMQEVVALAEKLKVLPWIRTAPNGQFGFGGARNCLFFLAPVIQAAVHRCGKKNLSEILGMQEQELRSLFDSAVMGKDGNDVAIHIGEDDVGILPCNFFSDGYYAETNKDYYYARGTLCYGRGTHTVNTDLDLKTVLNNPGGVFYSARWENHLFHGIMKGQLSKARFCLPIPFGHEEAHMMAVASESDYFQQPVFHLGGTRHPDNLYPHSPLEGLLSYLQTFIPYSFEMGLISYVFDSGNLEKRCAFPWSDKEFRESHRFKSLAEAWETINQTALTEEFRRRFWRNLKDFFDSLNDKTNEFGKTLLAMASFDPQIDAPRELKEFYQTIQREVQFFLAFGEKVIRYHERGDVDFLEKAGGEVEDLMRMRLAETQLAIKLSILVKGVQAWGSIPL